MRILRMALVLLMRHAKSSWAEQVLGDRKRPLNARGRTDAPIMAQWLRDQGLAPDQVVTSDAVRAVETWECMAPHFPNASATLRPEIYLAGTEALLDVLRQTSETTQRLLMIGHEPGISNAALSLAPAPLSEEMRNGFDRFTTANIAVININVPKWRDVRRGAGTCLDFARPSDLKSAMANGQYARN